MLSGAGKFIERLVARKNQILNQWIQLGTEEFNRINETEVKNIERNESFEIQSCWNHMFDFNDLKYTKHPVSVALS